MYLKHIASPDPAFATFLTVRLSQKVSTALPTSSVSLSGSVRTGELKQAPTQQSPQAGEQSRPCFLQLHQAVLQRKVSGVCGLSVITGIRVPSVSLYLQSHLNLWISSLKLHLAVHAKGMKFHCRRLWRQGLYFNCGCTFSCLFAKSSISQSLQTVAHLAVIPLPMRVLIP